MDEEKTKFIQAELEQVKQKAPNIEGVKLIACHPAMVSMSFKKTEQKQLTLCMQYPEKYPHDPIIIEYKSKTLAFKLLQGLSKVADAEAKKYIGQKQCMIILSFTKTFIEENPLCVCSDEISFVKRDLLTDADDIKLKQKNSQVVFKIVQDEFYFNFKVTVPDLYPEHQVGVEIEEHNFPELLKVNFLAQAIEIARRCVQPPIKKKPKDPPFEPKPSLRPVCDFLIRECVKKYPTENCPLCKDKALCADPKAKAGPGKEIERVYCGHLFHHSCLDKYMRTPPFQDKKCTQCGKLLFHEKWRVPPQLAEARWAHKQARERELEEVVDFLD